MAKNTKNAKPAKNVKATPTKRAPRVSKAKQAELENRIEDVNASKLSEKTKAAKAAEGQVPEALPAKPAKQSKANPIDGTIGKPGALLDKPARRWATGPKQNRSTVESPCHIVWDLFDNELKRAGSLDAMVRKDVIAAALAKGVNIDTAKTQYQRRRAAHLGK